jgi:hypothetical protein
VTGTGSGTGESECFLMGDAEPTAPEGLVTVARFEIRWRRRWPRGCWSRPGVECFLVGENANNLLQAAFRVRLQVRVEDEAAARELWPAREGASGGRDFCEGAAAASAAETAGRAAVGVEQPGRFIGLNRFWLRFFALRYQCHERVGVREMKIVISGNRIAGVLAAGLLSVVMVAHPGQLIAQAAAAPADGAPAGATIHGHVQNPAGMPLATGEVRLTTDRSANAPNAKFDYTFPIDASGNYKGTVDKPGNYIAVSSRVRTAWTLPACDCGRRGQDGGLRHDAQGVHRQDESGGQGRRSRSSRRRMRRPWRRTRRSEPECDAEVARADTARRATYDSAIKAMTDATAAKPDEPILWDTLGDAQLGQANAAAKAARTARRPTLP